MDLRFVEWRGEIFIVFGVGYDSTMEHPDIFTGVPLEKGSIFKTVITSPGIVKIPIAEAIEITDEKRIQTIWVLYGR